MDPAPSPRMHWLQVTTHVIVGVAVLVWIATHAWGIKHQLETEARARTDADLAKTEAEAKELLSRPTFAKMEMHAYTNAEEGRATITNVSDTPKYECMRSIVANNGGTRSTRSIEVCSGTVQSHSTVTLEMPYDVGAVHELCDGKPDGYGNRHIDWSLCSYIVEPVSDVPPTAPAASPVAPRAAPSAPASASAPTH